MAQLYKKELTNLVVVPHNFGYESAIAAAATFVGWDCVYLSELGKPIDLRNSVVLSLTRVFFVGTTNLDFINRLDINCKINIYSFGDKVPTKYLEAHNVRVCDGNFYSSLEYLLQQEKNPRMIRDIPLNKYISTLSTSSEYIKKKVKFKKKFGKEIEILKQPNTKEFIKFMVGISFLEPNKATFYAFKKYFGDELITFEKVMEYGDIATKAYQKVINTYMPNVFLTSTFDLFGKTIYENEKFPVIFTRCFINQTHVTMHEKHPNAPLTIIIMHTTLNNIRISVRAWNSKYSAIFVVKCFCQEERYGGNATGAGGLLKKGILKV